MDMRYDYCRLLKTFSVAALDYISESRGSITNLVVVIVVLLSNWIVGTLCEIFNFCRIVVSYYIQ